MNTLNNGPAVDSFAEVFKAHAEAMEAHKGSRFDIEYNELCEYSGEHEVIVDGCLMYWGNPKDTPEMVVADLETGTHDDYIQEHIEFVST